MSATRMETVEAIIVDVPTIRPHILSMATMQSQAMVIVRQLCSNGVEAAMASDGHEIYPASLGNSVRYAHQGTGKPVLITESGIAASDAALRQAYIPRSLQGLKAVMDEGVPVLGYTHWSLLDNFEWISGYGPQFGLVSVDRKSFAR